MFKFTVQHHLSGSTEATLNNGLDYGEGVDETMVLFNPNSELLVYGTVQRVVEDHQVKGYLSTVLYKA